MGEFHILLAEGQIPIEMYDLTSEDVSWYCLIFEKPVGPNIPKCINFSRKLLCT